MHFKIEVLMNLVEKKKLILFSNLILGHVKAWPLTIIFLCGVFIGFIAEENYSNDCQSLNITKYLEMGIISTDIISYEMG